MKHLVQRPLRPLMVASVAAAIAGCGGGGGSGSPAPVPTPAPPAADLVVTAELVATGYPDLFGNQRPEAIVGDTTVQVRFNATNNGPNAAQAALFRLDAVPGFTPTAIVCGNANGGASCPQDVTLQVAAGGISVNLPAGGGMSYTVTGTVTQSGTIAPRASAIAPATVTDSNALNNAANLALNVKAPDPATLVTSVPPHTYPAGSSFARAFEYLNGIRQRCGFGLVRQDTRLDQSAADHAQYLALNFDWLGLRLTFTQDPSRPGYTGATPTARAIARGYNAEFVGGTLSFGTLDSTPELVMLGLIHTTYHGASVLSGVRDIGIGEASDRWRFTAVTTGRLRSETGQGPASNEVALSPCDGERDRLWYHGSETPDPFNGLNPLDFGAPLHAIVRSDQKIAVLSWTITPVGSSQALPAQVRTADNDPNLATHIAVLIPNAPLARGQTYNVLLKGRNAGIPFERRYSFATRP
jgi:uncharacterized protein YkwD